METSEITLNIMKIIKSAMEVNNISYSQLAKETGVPKSTLQRCITGTTTKMSIDVLSKIASALDISMEIAKAMTPDLSFQEKITPHEKELIKKYRLISSEGKETVDTILDIQYRAVQPTVEENKVI